MRDSRIAALAIAGVLVLVIDGSRENRGIEDALRGQAQERADCERQVGRNLSRLVDRWGDLAPRLAAEPFWEPDPFFAETRMELEELAGVDFVIHRACAVAHRRLRLPAHDKCSRSAVRCHA